MWARSAQLAGFETGSIPKTGAIGVYRYGNHVVYVESVNLDGTIFISEMNFKANGGGWGRVSWRTTSANDFTYIY